MLTHQDVLRRGASAYGPHPALTAPDGRTYTYAELDEATDRLAHGLAERGLRRGERVVWLDQNSVEFLLAYYATAKLGAAFCPMNYWLRPGELRPLVELVDPAVVVAGREFVDVAAAATEAASPRLRVVLDGEADGWIPWAQLPSERPGPVTAEVHEDDPHEIVFTSGTTGQAKGVVRSQRKRLLDSYCAALAYRLNGQDHMLWFLPQFHVGGGSVPGQLLVQGGRVTVLRRFEPRAVAEAIGTGVTYLVGVPAHYNLLFESGVLEGVDTAAVRGCYVGGSIATRRVFEEILRRFPNAELVHGYGSTESGPHTMALRGQAFLDHFGALGLPVPGSEVRVVEPERRVDVGPGEAGELWVRSESVMDGYLGRPDLTEAAFVDGWLRTGDLVRRDAEGFFHLVDRVKDVIITGGENVYPKEVEDVLAAHPGVAEVAVVGVPDPTYEERVVAVVRPAPGAPAPGADELVAFVRERLAGYKTPKDVRFVEDFPRTGIGKIAKHELRRQYGSVFEERR